MALRYEAMETMLRSERDSCHEEGRIRLVRVELTDDVGAGKGVEGRQVADVDAGVRGGQHFPWSRNPTR